MTYEEAACKWASKKYDIPLEEIQKVSIDHYRGGGGCPTCDYGGGCEFSVSIVFNDPGKQSRFEEMYDFDILLREILAVE